MARSSPILAAAGMAAAAFALRTIWKAVLFPTTTAEGVAFSRYLLSDAGLLSEGIAKAFFPVKASFWTLHPSMRNFFFKVIPGGASHLATRTWFYDANFARLLKPDMQVVICGAGFDSRAYRLHAPRGVRFFEVDLPLHPGVQEYKAGRLARYGIVTDQVRLLPIDHKTQSLADVLKAGATTLEADDLPRRRAHYVSHRGVHRGYGQVHACSGCAWILLHV